MVRHYLQFISTAPPAWQFGGPTRLAHSYLTIARSAFARASIATVALQPHAQAAVADATGVAPHDVLLAYAPRRKLALSLGGPRFWAAAWRLVRGAPRTVVHLLEFKSMLALSALLLRRLAPGRVRLVHSAFGQLSTIDPDRPLTRLLCRLYFACVDVVLCQSETEAAEVRRLAARFTRRGVALRILPLAVLDAPAGLAAEPAGPARDGPGRRAIFLGRVVPEKGVLEALACVRRLHAAGGLQSFAAYGPRQDEAYEQALATAMEAATGEGIACRRASVGDPANRYTLYAEADVFVMLPTVKEESSLATIEALVSGCKVVLNGNCLIPGLERLPSLIRQVTPETPARELADWLAQPGTAADLRLARQLFIEQGRQAFLQALDLP